MAGVDQVVVCLLFRFLMAGVDQMVVWMLLHYVVLRVFPITGLNRKSLLSLLFIVVCFLYSSLGISKNLSLHVYDVCLL